MRRTTMGMNVTSTDTNVPAQMALKKSMRKLRRTREGSQSALVTG